MQYHKLTHKQYNIYTISLIIKLQIIIVLSLSKVPFEVLNSGAVEGSSFVVNLFGASRVLLEEATEGLSEDLAEFDTVLVETVDIPKEACHDCSVLVDSEQLSETVSVQFFEEKTG